MALILAIDPGTTQSGWCVYRDGKVVDSGVLDNPGMLERIRSAATWDPRIHLAVEMIASQGLPVGASTFRTVWWIGRFAEAWMAVSGRLPVEVYRRDVKLHLCGHVRAKDKNIRQALIDRYGGEGGKDAAIGKKASPGPLFGVSSHAWSALAVAVTAHETMIEPAARAA
jgi:hypothetical protein